MLTNFINIFVPLNIFISHGCFCCSKLYSSYKENLILKNFSCYSTDMAESANVLLIFGHLNSRLSNLLNSKRKLMPQKNIMINVAGCSPIFNNPTSADLLFKQCELDQALLKNIILEAKKCLRA